ncbi:MAG: DsbA family protein [Candidatus Nomurabacteria bacterium]|jgi:protein-disulfide isomerase|nr:DsbA family protein [Candidatus Nomurabacteria bacterium]
MKTKSGSVAVWVLVVVVAILVVALFAYNAKNPSKNTTEPAWNSAMTMGNSDNKNHFIEYTDMFCPYCARFNRALGEDFEKDYIKTDKLFFELRLTDVIAEHSVNSTRGGETGYCAAQQDKFWPYYDAILAKLKADYHDKGIGVSKTSPQIPKLDDSYFLDAAKTAKLDVGKVQACLKDGSGLKELRANTARAAQVLPSGVPFFILNSYYSSGFEGNYDTVKLMIKAGGVK